MSGMSDNYQLWGLGKNSHIFFGRSSLCFLLLSSDWSNLLSECSLASPGSPCTNLEADDCKYEHIGDHCCCGQCSDSPWLSLACVLDSTTGAGTWQPISLCPVGGCGSEGECWKGNCQNLSFLDSWNIFFPQVFLPQQTIPTTILIIWSEQRW